MFKKVLGMIPPPPPSPHDGCECDEGWGTGSVEQEFLNLPSGRDERSEIPDSGYRGDVGSRATSPLYPEQKTEEPPVLPDPRVDSPSAVQVNNVNPVDNKVQDPSTFSIKGRRKFFDSIGGAPNPSK